MALLNVVHSMLCKCTTPIRTYSVWINIFNLNIILSRIGIVVVGGDVDDGVIGTIFTYIISLGVHVAARMTGS